MAINFEKNIAPLKERELYPDEGAQKYLWYWFSIQDRSVPKFIPRDQWEEKRAQHETFVVQSDTLLIFLPEDVKLWEIFTFIREIDQHTYQDALKAKAEREKLKAVITTFRDAGIYLKTYVEQIDWTDDPKAEVMAKGLATDFYRYSRWLQFRKRREVVYEQVPGSQLLPEQNRVLQEERFREVENVLIGTTLVAKRYDRLEKSLGREATQQEIDQERARVVKLFFKGLVRDYHAQLDFDKEEEEPRPANQDLSWKRYAEQYLGKQDSDLTEEQKAEKKRLENDFIYSKPWNKFGPTFAFQQAAALGLERFYDKPKQEFEAAILRRGKEKLKTLNAVKTEDFLSKMGIDFSNERKRLVDVLDINTLKARLQKLKESGASSEVIAQEELTIVSKIQREISKYEYEEMTSLPADIVGNEQINCVGASLLSSVLFDEIGINYLEVSIEGHSVVVVITSDDKVHYRDMRYAYLNRELTDAEVGEGNTEAITRFANNTTEETLSFLVNPSWYRSIKFDKDFVEPTFSVIHSGQGFSRGLLNNFVELLLTDVDNNHESIETIIAAMEQHIQQFPKDMYVLRRLAELYIETEADDAAIFLLYRIEQLGTDYREKYSLWGELFYFQEKYELSLECLRKSLIYNPKNTVLWESVADCLEQLGRMGAYKITLEKALEFTGDDVFKRKLIDYHVANGELGEALDLYEELIPTYHDDYELWTEYYYLLFKDEPSQGNCRMILSKLDPQKDEEKIAEIIEFAKQNNYEEDWPSLLQQEYALTSSFAA